MPRNCLMLSPADCIAAYLIYLPKPYRVTAAHVWLCSVRPFGGKYTIRCRIFRAKRAMFRLTKISDSH